MLGLMPTSDAPREELRLAVGLREYTRRYFTVEATGRYYRSIGDTFEGWVGLTGGRWCSAIASSLPRERPTRRW